jgi:hypothetical protein
MEGTELEVSMTAPSVSDFAARFRTLEVEATPGLSESANDMATINCGRRRCQRLVSSATLRKVTARELDGTTKAMLVCTDCFNHYHAKSSTITRK